MLAELETAVDQRSVNGRPASVCDSWELGMPGISRMLPGYDNTDSDRPAVRCRHRPIGLMYVHNIRAVGVTITVNTVVTRLADKQPRLCQDKQIHTWPRHGSVFLSAHSSTLDDSADDIHRAERESAT